MTEIPTNWTHVIVPAGQGSRAARAELYRRYKPVIFSYIVRHARGIKKEPEDLLHDFYLDNMQRVASGADRNRGKFRALLFQSLNNFLLDERRDQSRKKRDGGMQTCFEDDLAGESDPEVEFNRMWVQTACKRAVRQLERELRAQQRDKPEVRADIHILDASISDFITDEAAEYGTTERLAAALDLTPSAYRKRRYQLRERFKALLTQELAATVLRDDLSADDDAAHEAWRRDCQDEFAQLAPRWTRDGAPADDCNA